MTRGWHSNTNTVNRFYTLSCDCGQNPSQAKNLESQRTNSDDKGPVGQDPDWYTNTINDTYVVHRKFCFSLRTSDHVRNSSCLAVHVGMVQVREK